MTNISAGLVRAGGEPYLTIIIEGEEPRVIRGDHPHYEKIANLVVNKSSVPDAQELIDLCDANRALQRHFRRLGERVTVANGVIYLDGDEVHNSLTKQVLRFLNEGVDDWEPLVKFFEKVITNPSEHSRDQLYNWLDANNFSITDEGDIVGYKGVNAHADREHEFYSINSGYGIVNGVEYENSQLPNPIGAIVEMPSEMVVSDPNTGCAVGLHVATHKFAADFGQHVLEVHVNPRDVRSVPRRETEKVRVCRYRVVRLLQDEYKLPVVPSYPVDKQPEVDPPEQCGCGNNGPCECGNECANPDCPCKSMGLADTDDRCPCGELSADECNGDSCQLEGSDEEELPTAPTEQEWEGMRAVAKRQKKSVRAVAPTRGWLLVGEDPDNREHWAVAS